MANWNEEAKRLLPCAWENINDTMCDGPDKCGACQKRPAVARALAEEADRWYSLGRADEILQPETKALFHIQDDDRPLWIVATDYLQALAKWRRRIAEENPDDPDSQKSEPRGISKICDDDELIP